MFVVRVKDDAGNVVERKYKLNTPIVRRVLAPGEQKEARQSAVSSRQKAKKEDARKQSARRPETTVRRHFADYSAR